MSERGMAVVEADVVARIPSAAPDVTPSRAEIATVVAQIAERFRPERIMLFGSRAYGTPHSESDVDLLVVLDTSLPRGEVRQAIGRDLSSEYQIVVRTPAEIRLGLAEHDFFVEDMMLKGIALYTDNEGRMSEGENGGPPARQEAGLKHATSVLLEKADQAARAAEQLLIAPSCVPDYVCFLAQQAVELSLKGLLQEHEIRFSRTHELDKLAALAVGLVPELADYVEQLKTLSICAVQMRYTALTLSVPEAEAAVELMREVRALILAALPASPTSPE